MTFITLNNSARIKIGDIINYVSAVQQEGVTPVYVINIWQSTQFATSFTQVQYATQALRDADLKLLDAAVHAFVEPAPTFFLSGNLTVHNSPLPFYTLAEAQPAVTVSVGGAPVAQAQ